ncbi:MAG: hypothetical protein ACE14P_13890 [Methanotrichaceae archaeon]
MRSLLAAAVFIVIVAFTICPAMGENYFYVKDMNMRLDEGNAIFEINYTLEMFTKFYVIALGCKYIEPDLISVLGYFNNVSTIRADPDSAAMIASGAGKYNSGYYLFESRPLGIKVDKLTVVYPEGRPKTFYNVTSTPNVFCIARSPPNQVI